MWDGQQDLPEPMLYAARRLQVAFHHQYCQHHDHDNHHHRHGHHDHDCDRHHDHHQHLLGHAV